MVLLKPLISLIIVLCAANTAFGQGQSHWGIGGSIVPRWTFLDMVAQVMDIQTDVHGTEFRVGVVRGRDLGGDWGVMFLRKVIADGSVWQERETSCVQTFGDRRVCSRGTFHITRDASLTGAEFYRFFPFGTIAERVQIGTTLGGEVGWIKGTSDRFLEHLQIAGPTVTPVTQDLGNGPFRDVFPELDVVPIGRAELAVAVIVAPGLKLRASGGVSFPGYQVASVHLHYLFGAR